MSHWIKAAALAFAALQVGPSQAASCAAMNNEANCEVDVAVLEITSRICVVLLPKPIDHTRVGFKKAAKITWQLVTPTPEGYVFADGGITFGDSTDFDCNSPGGNLTYSCDNKATLQDVFKYTISVKHQASKRNCLTLDPWVRNQ